MNHKAPGDLLVFPAAQGPSASQRGGGGPPARALELRRCDQRCLQLRFQSGGGAGGGPGQGVGEAQPLHLVLPLLLRPAGHAIVLPAFVSAAVCPRMCDMHVSVCVHVTCVCVYAPVCAFLCVCVPVRVSAHMGVRAPVCVLQTQKFVFQGLLIQT